MERVGWSPSAEDHKMPWGPNTPSEFKHPGVACNGPPGEGGLVFLILEAMGANMQMSDEQVHSCCCRVGARMSLRGRLILAGVGDQIIPEPKSNFASTAAVLGHCGLRRRPCQQPIPSNQAANELRNVRDTWRLPHSDKRHMLCPTKC